MKHLRDAAKLSAAKKIASFKGSSTGTKFSDNGRFGDAAEPVDGEEKTKGRMKDDGVEAVKMAKDGGAIKRLDKKPRKARKAGGRVAYAEGGKFEGSKKDEAEDKKLAKKHGMSMKAWEKSKLDEKHDAQESMEGLRKGGVARRSSGGTTGRVLTNNQGSSGASGRKPAPPEDQGRYNSGGRVKRADGGRVSKGKTTVNIVISPPGQGTGGIASSPPVPPPSAVPVPVPMGGPPGGMPPMPPPGMGGSGMGPLMRKRGGRITSPADLTAGALSGEGRLQKIELQRNSKR